MVDSGESREKRHRNREDPGRRPKAHTTKQRRAAEQRSGWRRREKASRTDKQSAACKGQQDSQQLKTSSQSERETAQDYCMVLTYLASQVVSVAWRSRQEGVPLQLRLREPSRRWEEEEERRKGREKKTTKTTMSAARVVAAASVSTSTV